MVWRNGDPGPTLDREQRRLVRPVFEHAPLAQKGRQVLRVEVADASRKMQQHKIHSLIVERCDGLDAYGIITDTDIVQKVLAPDHNPAAVYVREVMSKPIITIPPDCTLFEMAQLMTRHHINHLPVFEIWRDAQAQGAHANAPHTRDFRAKLVPLQGALYDERLYTAIR